MARKAKTSDKVKTGARVTLAIRLVDGSLLPVEAGVDAMRFIGRYSRVSAFGPLGTRITARLIERG